GRECEAEDLSAYWVGILSARDFLGTSPSYTLIRDLMLRLCHRLITCSIVGRSQAPEKLTLTDLFYLRGMDVGSVNIPYLLARSLTKLGAWVASGPKRQQVATAGTLKVAKDALVVDESAPAVPALVQAPHL
nr:hypothetical protein [Tanacetum cinerariifolium]